MPKTNQAGPASSNILLVGDSGNWKTGFIGECPDPFIYDFDKGTGVLRNKPIEYETFKDLPKGLLPTDTERKAGLYPFGGAWPAFIKQLTAHGLAMDKAGFPYKTLGLDSLTFLGFNALNRVCEDTGAFNPKNNLMPMPNQGSWGAQQEYIKSVLGQLTAWPVRIVATAHIQRDKNDVTGTIEKLPLLTGKLAGFISAFFDEVWFCEQDGSKDANGFPNFIARTLQTNDMRQAKSRAGVPDKTPLHWEAVKKYLGA